MSSSGELGLFCVVGDKGVDGAIRLGRSDILQITDGRERARNAFTIQTCTSHKTDSQRPRRLCTPHRATLGTVQPDKGLLILM